MIYLSLGSNIGDRAGNLNAAIDRLRAFGEVVAISSFYETEPVEFTAQAWFLNCAVALDTEKTPQQLLAGILDIEQQLGRRRGQKKGPRIIDLDILLFGNSIVDDPGLTIPHPAMHERRFVLEPLGRNRTRRASSSAQANDSRTTRCVAVRTSSAQDKLATDSTDETDSLLLIFLSALIRADPWLILDLRNNDSAPGFFRCGHGRLFLGELRLDEIHEGSRLWPSRSASVTHAHEEDERAQHIRIAQAGCNRGAFVPPPDTPSAFLCTSATTACWLRLEIGVS